MVRRRPPHSPSSSHGHASPRLIMMTVPTSGALSLPCLRRPDAVVVRVAFVCSPIHSPVACPSTLLFAHAHTPRTPTHLFVHASTSLTIPLVHALAMLLTHASTHKTCSLVRSFFSLPMRLLTHRCVHIFKCLPTSLCTCPICPHTGSPTDRLTCLANHLSVCLCVCSSTHACIWTPAYSPARSLAC